MVLRSSVVVFAAWLGAACGGGQPVPAESAADVEPTLADDSAELQSPPALASADGNFAIAAVPQPPFAVGGEARTEVSLEGRNGYHVNQEYPIELRIEAPPGVELAKTRFVRADASVFEEARAVFPVVFTPRDPGRKEFTGELSFSVCNPQNCLLERRPVVFAVDVP